MRRAAGILLHPTALANGHPIGDLGPAAHRWVDFLAAAGQRWWQMLPLGPVDADGSPYHSASSFALSPLLVSPDALIGAGLLRRADLDGSPRGGARVDYRRVAAWKGDLLRSAHAVFRARHGAQGHPALHAFARRSHAWLGDQALFMALCAAEGTDDWTVWPQPLRARDPRALRAASARLAAAIDHQVFVQWLLAQQWDGLRARCRHRGIRLIGDLPLFVSHRSADVWSNPRLFKLDGAGRPRVVAGVPPDAFAKDGQVWGMPIYDWTAGARDGHAWWLRRLTLAARRFDLVRLDHFIGLVRVWEIPAHHRTARRGRYVRSGGAAMLRAAARGLRPLPLIAEDLGIVTPAVRRLVRAHDIPGMRVLQFELLDHLDDVQALRGGGNARAVFYTGTHDNDTLKGWLAAQPATVRATLARALGCPLPALSGALVDLALGMPNELVVVPLQDHLGLGSSARMNRPGSAAGNWRWRVPARALTVALARRLRAATHAAGR
jgi:4-alpha-glucanotransferase